MSHPPRSRFPGLRCARRRLAGHRLGARWLTLGLVCGLAVACSAPVREYRCRAPRGAEATVEAQWECNRRIIVRIVKGKPFSIDEFEAAAAFFERLTKIPADSIGTYLGLLPGRDLRSSLRRWDTWYREHGTDLYRDAASGEVRLAGD